MISAIFTSYLDDWRRFWRLPEMRLLFLALLVSVIAVTSVGFFTDRADRAMNTQATQLMGGDLVIQSTRPIDDSFTQEAQKQGLKTASVISFPSMVSIEGSGKDEGKFQLAQIKAVSPNYPLHGEIETSTQITGDQYLNTISNIKNSEAWAEPRLLVALSVNSAGKEVRLGQSKIRLSQVIRKMPDQATNAFQFAPVLILPQDQLDKTGLLSVASRASYSLYLAGEEKQIKQFSKWLKPQLKPGERIRSLEDGLPSVQQALQRGQRFLKLASLLAVILAGAGIALSSFSLVRRETSSVAVLKTLGASRKQILNRYLSQLFVTATLAAFVGALLGYIIQFLLALSLQDFVGQELPPAGWQPVWLGFATAWVMALGFSVPQLMQLMNIAPMQIFQEQKAVSKTSYLLTMVTSAGAIVIGVFTLMWLQTEDAFLSLTLLLGVLFSLLVFWILARLLVWSLKRLEQKFSLPKANQRMVILVVVFGIGLFSLLLLTTLRGDLINRWQASLPPEAPNHFLINIQPDELKPIQGIFASKNIKAPLYPMVLGRLVEINSEKVSPDDYDLERAKRLLIREFNMSATEDIPEGNVIVSGQWFGKNEKEGFSVEEGIAKTLKLKMGDRLGFDIAGQKFTQTITSLRKVQWDSMKPNFFVMAAPLGFENRPKTFITSVHISDEDKQTLPDLIRQFPSVTDIDISAIMTQVRELIDKAAFAVQAIFLFTLIAGVVVLFSALQSQKPERRKEIAILKTVGASRSFIRANLLVEFSLIGALSGFLAGVLAVVAGNIAAYSLFEMTPEINFSLIAIGTLMGAILVGAAGYFNLRGLLSVVPVSLFR